MELASVEYSRVTPAPLVNSPNSALFAVAMAFQQHVDVCEDLDARRERELKFLSGVYNRGDQETKREVIERMKVLIRSERANGDA